MPQKSLIKVQILLSTIGKLMFPGLTYRPLLVRPSERKFCPTNRRKLRNVISTTSHGPIRNYAQMKCLTKRAFPHLSEHQTFQAFCQYDNWQSTALIKQGLVAQL